jgi:hypothetical protein
MQKVMIYIGYAAGTIFMFLGLALMFTDLFQMNNLPSNLKMMMGVVLFLYGLFRIIALLYKKRQKNEEG